MTNTEPPLLSELKRRYEILINSLDGTDFEILRKKRSIITAKYDDSDGNIAYNVNKGYEIFMCLDGKNINGAMYVLLHELAHITVDEYDHSERFWKNFKKLREHAVNIGIYTPEPEMVYCGQTIKDSIYS